MRKYVIQQRTAGARRYRVKREIHRGLVAINGIPTPAWLFFTRRGAERWIQRRELDDQKRPWHEVAVRDALDKLDSTEETAAGMAAGVNRSDYPFGSQTP